ncbi:MAG: bifunctional phosphoribosylaminoimidazolecarboxamide formyltransferase/IMP cyclohydrolase [Streptococcaceae bacterium]|jgi:phosphoribosylaminoimidazolecarboxamide formyltransferase/IMP cyclohydrolase|nr:bifunctional phosphoribosylaminoimidazolecarboxamide formyltransferase/IMP cyclohydrolase [Streptococcaceae bacterium]
MTRALISVSDKTGIVELAKELVALGIEIISTGGTKSTLEASGIATIGIEDVTGFPEMMDGRVKTLHPLVHGGLLGRRDLETHVDAMAQHNIQPIDYVIVNLYPFKETILKPDVTEAEAIENIDIGGPSMLRSAAKNNQSVTVIVDPRDYEVVLNELKESGKTTPETRLKLAAKVFRHTAAYDALIAGYLTEVAGEKTPEKLTLTYDLKQGLRYGENNHQDADFYQSALQTDYSISSAKQLNGKELSFNNIRDADAAIRIAREYQEPTVVALKHMNPCGIGTAETIENAWDYAYAADPVSIFGGIVVLNREVDKETAEKMHPIFLEIIIAPSFSEEAFQVLTNKKKNLRLLQLDFSKIQESEKELEFTGVVGGMLVQNQDVIKENSEDWKVVTERQPSEKELKALEFAWKSIKYVKSNAILIANDHQTLGVGAGQMNRVGSVKIAIQQAKDRLDGAVLASDAFFPFSDNIEEIAAAGIRAIIQPGGSVRDEESIVAANKHGMTMIFTGVRHFRH